MKEKSLKPCSLELKSLDTKQGIVEFYAANFGNKDSDGDIILKGAYKKTLSENKSRLKHFKNHDFTMVPGVITEISEDEKGLLVVSKIANTTLGKDTMIEYEAGIITEHSQGFKIIKEHQEKDANIISEIKLWEVSSLTAWGANEMTPVVSVKSAEDVINLLSKIEVLLKKGNITEEHAKKLLLKSDELNTILKSLVMPEQSTNEPKEEDVLRESINKSITNFSLKIKS